MIYLKRKLEKLVFLLAKNWLTGNCKLQVELLRVFTTPLRHGISMNIAGGTHHAFYDRGEAFCMLNDQAIAANYLINKGLSKRILIIDLDVHQGNGTASLFRSNNKVYTLSFHGKKNYPFRKEKSDLDIEFDDNTNDMKSI